VPTGARYDADLWFYHRTRGLIGTGGGAASKLGRVPEITEDRYPWPAASATGVGSLPGTDPVEAQRLIFGELPDLPHLAELPGRGPGADLTGRTAALLVDMPVELTSAGWRFTARPGRDLRRALGFLSADLDALEEVSGGYAGPLKIQVCGPWTLAATIELIRSQDPALADPGAVADLTASLAEGLAAHVAEVRNRVPGARIVVQLDEPGLPAVMAGNVPTASRLNRLPVPESSDLEAGLGSIISAAGAFTLVHCCALSVPFGIIKGAGADGVGCDLGTLEQTGEDGLAEAVEAGLGIVAGVVPATGTQGAPEPPAADRAARAVTALWQRLGWPVARDGGAGPGGMTAQVVLAPACGMAGATPGYARAAMARCREAARLLPELIEEAR
jgi:Cobalamin-independent synthase, Catalytic domain